MVMIKQLFTLITLSFLSFASWANVEKLASFGTNPGELEASYFAPTSKPSSLVVLLHGCGQNSEQLAQKSGFLSLAKAHNFALLLPQQTVANNIKYCFNWYSADDFSKDKGENLSIKNMIVSLQKQLKVDKTYLVGLSAGGAMASNILVNYPELFTSAAVVAGIPFPCADGLITGISCMKNGPSQTVNELVALIKKQQPNQAQWPKLSVWTGSQDGIVNPLNSSILAKLWAQLLTMPTQEVVESKPGYRVTRWQNLAHETFVQLVEVNDLGHGIMVNPNEKNGGEVSDYILKSPISTAKHLIDFWQL